nr:DUF2946 domain-containing protein [uncultured Neokomagataea sp.]
MVGLSGQLTLQSQALPDEAPRITLERLTGLHIGPSAHSMDAHCATMMRMPSKNRDKNQSPSCPLCPLLHLPIVILGLAIIALLIARLRTTTRYNLSPLPPILAQRAAFLPPPTGPPTLA